MSLIHSIQDHENFSTLFLFARLRNGFQHLISDYDDVVVIHTTFKVFETFSRSHKRPCFDSTISKDRRRTFFYKTPLSFGSSKILEM